MPGQPNTLWQDALLAASMIALDPEGLVGVVVRARSGGVRDRWLEVAATLAEPGAPIRRIAAGIADARLTGGLDIGLTVEAGRPVVERGVLAAADGGRVVLAMAERLEPSAAALIGMALDEGAVRIERDGISATQPARFALIALDEGIDDEGLAASLADRLGLRIDLDAIALREVGEPAPTVDLGAARLLLPQVSIDQELVEALCDLALSAGAVSMRAPLHLMRAARAAAALRGSAVASVEDAATALRLVLCMRESAREDAETPDRRSEPEPPPSPDQPGGEREEFSAEALRDMLVQAVDAVLPEHLLEGLGAGASRNRQRGEAGKAGAVRNRARRGRVIGTSEKPPAPGARIDVLATLRQAAPWQRIRAGSQGTGDRQALRIRKSDFRYLRFREKTGTTAIFAVDASGSAAVERLAETKGAIELLLAECYVRRDQVALIAFRGKSSETLLEPTRSLVRAKRSLSALPGGGGTPLAGGILATLAMAMSAARRGQSVVTVFLTDGRGNVGLDGGTERAQVEADLEKAAAVFRAAGIRAIVIDTGRRPQPRAETLARSLGAEYLALPRGGSQAVAREIGARMEA